MAYVILDSDIIIDHSYASVAGIPELIRSASVATTVLNVFELERGLRASKNAEVVKAVLRNLPIIPLDPPAAELAARIGRGLDRQGLKLDLADLLIAGITLSVGGRLWTRSRRHFARVPGLELC